MKSGKISESVLKRSVLKQIHTVREEVIIGAGIGEDCAILALSDNEVMALTVDPVIVTGKDMECYAVYAVINDLAATGARPIGIMLSLLLPETAYESDLKNMMSNIEAECAALKIQIIGGHTEVTRAVSYPVITITGVGKVKKNEVAATKGAVPGQDIVVSKWIGLEGTALIAWEKEKELQAKYPNFLVHSAQTFRQMLSIIPEAATAIRSGVRTMHDVAKGGIFGALWEIAESSGVGLEIDLSKLPIRQETIEVCELFDINPYQMVSSGSLIMVTDNGYDLVRALEKENIKASIVGTITDSNDRVVINDGEKRFLEPPRTDEIYKL